MSQIARGKAEIVDATMVFVQLKDKCEALLEDGACRSNALLGEVNCGASKCEVGGRGVSCHTS